ncbi:MAG: hypothetical protein CBB92_06445 [Flammeovirgaceae bacterium TMED32]|nr:MAG: hypothetical protein CBB92_06445 [Flammeovirgaceae bacterium TMED32]
MTKDYTITGMRCKSCMAKVKTAINSFPSIQDVGLQLDYPQANITSEKSLDLEEINLVLKKFGDYTITDAIQGREAVSAPPLKGKYEFSERSINTYLPLLLIIGFISGISVLIQYPFIHFSPMLWMRHFMAGFFLVFSFFKLLNLSGFANAYRMYDIVAAKWNFWGYLYPFVELMLGILYLINIAPFYVNLTTVIVLGVSSVGVIKSNLKKEQIKCACLGDVFQLPMSTVTIFEDLSMVLMALIGLFLL